jgi:hypothetical protein
MKCVTAKATRDIQWEKDKNGGSPKKVIFITHKQKCSDYPDQLKLEEEEMEKCELLADTEEETLEGSSPAEEIKEWRIIKEHFKRLAGL